MTFKKKTSINDFTKFIHKGWCGSPVVRRRTTNPGVRGSNPGLEISEMLFSVSHLHGTEKKLYVMSEVPV